MFIRLIRLMIVLFHLRRSQEIVTLVLWLHKPLFRLLLPDISRFDRAAGAAVFAWEWSFMVVLQVRCSWRLKRSSRFYWWLITYCADPKGICWVLLEIQKFGNEAPLSFYVTSLTLIKLSPNFHVTPPHRHGASVSVETNPFIRLKLHAFSWAPRDLAWASALDCHADVTVPVPLKSTLGICLRLVPNSTHPGFLNSDQVASCRFGFLTLCFDLNSYFFFTTTQALGCIYLHEQCVVLF